MSPLPPTPTKPWRQFIYKLTFSIIFRRRSARGGGKQVSQGPPPKNPFLVFFSFEKAKFFLAKGRRITIISEYKMCGGVEKKGIFFCFLPGKKGRGGFWERRRVFLGVEKNTGIQMMRFFSLSFFFSLTHFLFLSCPQHLPCKKSLSSSLKSYLSFFRFWDLDIYNIYQISKPFSKKHRHCLAPPLLHSLKERVSPKAWKDRKSH